MDIVGISCFYHDSSACLVRNGKIIAAAQEERFSRIKNTSDFPINALDFCSKFGNTPFRDVEAIAYFEKPYLKFSRVLIDHLNEFPFSLPVFLRSIPQWMGQRLILPLVIQDKLSTNAQTYFFSHHLSHAASTFLPSPFEEAAILTLDGVGEWTTACSGRGRGASIYIDQEIRYPDSLGLLYTTFTVFLGFNAHGEEGKTMGMAAYGEPRYLAEMEKIIHIYSDGSFKLDKKYFAFQRGKTMWSHYFEKIFGKPHIYGTPWDQKHFNIAASLQVVLEKAIILSARHLNNRTKLKNLCLAGGVALNCIANAKILEETNFQNIFIQPAAGDAGGSVGAALYLSNTIHGHPRHTLDHCFLGPSYSEEEILLTLKSYQGLTFQKLTEDELVKKSADCIFQNKILGFFQGRMEFGPRALGNRSIFANPCLDKMKDIINTKIKKRESFRPFAPTVLLEECEKYFDLKVSSPYMLLAPKVHMDKQKLISAVTHVDGTARVQTVGKSENPLLRRLLLEFERKSGVPIILNTSFNQSNEPVVCTPEQAVNCYLSTELDALAIGPFWLEKNIQI